MGSCHQNNAPEQGAPIFKKLSTYYDMVYHVANLFLGSKNLSLVAFTTKPILLPLAPQKRKSTLEFTFVIDKTLKWFGHIIDTGGLVYKS